MNSEQLTHWREQARAFVKMLGEMVYGATVYEMVRDLNKERGMIERLFVLVVFGDVLGVPILPPYYALRLLPYVTPKQTRLEFPDRYLPTPEMSYEEFLRTCNVFPDVDFSRNSLLGFQATGKGCSVTFEKHVYRDDQTKTILYNLTVVEEGRN